LQYKIIVKESLKEVATKTDLPLTAMQILKFVDVLVVVELMINVKNDIVACIV
jgi:hypothetical protein